MGVDRDQADRLLARDRAEPLLHAAGGEAEAAGADQIDADEIAVLGAVGIGLGAMLSSRPACFLSTGIEPAAAIRSCAEDAERCGCWAWSITLMTRPR